MQWLTNTPSKGVTSEYVTWPHSTQVYKLRKKTKIQEQANEHCNPSTPQNLAYSLGLESHGYILIDLLRWQNVYTELLLNVLPAANNDFPIPPSCTFHLFSNSVLLLYAHTSSTLFCRQVIPFYLPWLVELYVQALLEYFSDYVGQ